MWKFEWYNTIHVAVLYRTAEEKRKGSVKEKKENVQYLDKMRKKMKCRAELWNVY